MLNNSKAFIWDLDGTLLDSYPGIVKNLECICLHYGIEYTQDEIMRYVIKYSVGDFFNELAVKCQKTFDEVKNLYSKTAEINNDPITLMEGAFDTLHKVIEKGHINFVYTHKGATTQKVLSELGIKDMFTDIVSSLDGFKRKPSPEGLEHLIGKWKLDRQRVFYVGDRTLDMECAKNAGVHGVLYKPPGSVAEADGKEYAVIKDLSELSQWL